MDSNVGPMMRRRKRRALKLLAASGPRGRADSLFLARFTPELLDLVGEGLATARPESLGLGRLKFEAVRIRITDAGRDALEGWVQSRRRRPLVAASSVVRSARLRARSSRRHRIDPMPDRLADHRRRVLDLLGDARLAVPPNRPCWRVASRLSCWTIFYAPDSQRWRPMLSGMVTGQQRLPA